MNRKGGGPMWMLVSGIVALVAGAIVIMFLRGYGGGVFKAFIDGLTRLIEDILPGIGPGKEECDIRGKVIKLNPTTYPGEGEKITVTLSNIPECNDKEATVWFSKLIYEVGKGWLMWPNSCGEGTVSDGSLSVDCTVPRIDEPQSNSIYVTISHKFSQRVCIQIPYERFFCCGRGILRRTFDWMEDCDRDNRGFEHQCVDSGNGNCENKCLRRLYDRHFWYPDSYYAEPPWDFCGDEADYYRACVCWDVIQRS